MKKYIRIDKDKNIVDVFLEYQKDKMENKDKIYIGDKPISHKINGKHICDDMGTYVYTWSSTGGAIKKKLAEIEVISKPLRDAEIYEKQIQAKIKEMTREAAIAEL